MNKIKAFWKSLSCFKRTLITFIGFLLSFTLLGLGLYFFSEIVATLGLIAAIIVLLVCFWQLSKALNWCS